MKLNQAFLPLLVGKNLTRTQALKFFTPLLKGNLAPSEAKTLLLLLALKGETVDEILGCLQAVRRFEPVQHLKVPHLMDTCGTGGDQSHSFNISTLAAFVIAGAGGKVAKHGNRAISSKCGSSDLMEALGVNLKASRRRMIEAIQKAGIGYFHAPFYHPVFMKLQPLRRQLKTRTIFNLLGPLLNPFALHDQLVGVAQKAYVKLFAQILKKLGVQSALVVHSADGTDEISVSSVTYAASIKSGKIRYFKLQPTRNLFHTGRNRDLKGGTVKQNRQTALNFLEGHLHGTLRQTILINAGAGLRVSGMASSLKEGIKLAEEALDSGKAKQALVALKQISHQK